MGSSPYIDQIVLHNNQDPYTVALIVPNKDALKRDIPAWDSPEGKKEAILLIKKSIDIYRKGGTEEGIFPERWLPASFALLAEPFTEQNLMVNSTMKIVRGRVEEHYAARTKGVYTTNKDIYNSENIAALQ